MVEVRTWWRGELQQVCCFAAGEVRVGLVGAELYVPMEGPPVTILEHRQGWIATEPPGWRLQGGEPQPRAPLRWCAVSRALVTWTAGDWTVDARLVRLPAGIGRPAERPWIPAFASIASVALIAWVALRPPTPEYVLMELHRPHGFYRLDPVEVASARSTAAADAGVGPGGTLLARRPLALPREIAPTSGRPVVAEQLETLGSVEDLRNPGAGRGGDGVDSGHPGLGANRSSEAVFAEGWVWSEDDARIAVVPRTGVGFAPVLDLLRAGELPDADRVRPEAPRSMGQVSPRRPGLFCRLRMKVTGGRASTRLPTVKKTARTARLSSVDGAS